MESQAKMRTGTRLIAGTILVLAGGALALGNSGLFMTVELQRSGPLALIAMGLPELVVTMRSPRLSGFGLLLLGDWLFMNTLTHCAYKQLAWPLPVARPGT